MKNYITRTFIFTLIVFIILILLYFLPTISFDGHILRKVDLFADIREQDPNETIEVDSALLPVLPKPAFIDTCMAGMTCIEDYADSTGRGMKAFYEALNRVNEMYRPVYVAVFGDSFIEADIFTSDLRELFQTRFGGNGVGFVPITSLTNGYRPTVHHSFGGWSSHAVTDTAYFDHSKQGIAGNYFIPQSDAYVEARGQNKFGMHLDTCDVATLYFTSVKPLKVSSLINKKIQEIHTFEGTDSLCVAQASGKIGRIRWSVSQVDSALFYGFTMDGYKGISIDNFSLRGSSGLSLKGIPSAFLSRFNKKRPYDLIILQYGLNVATERGKNYDNYKKGMLKVIEHLKRGFPNASILLLSVGDRDYKTEAGNLRTMPGVKNLVRYQKAIAAESGIAYWNMFEAMGGEGSMAKLVHAKPSMANYDYTHINFRGGKYLATLLYETLIYGKSQYDKRQEYEK